MILLHLGLYVIWINDSFTNTGLMNFIEFPSTGIEQTLLYTSLE